MSDFLNPQSGDILELSVLTSSANYELKNVSEINSGISCKQVQIVVQCIQAMGYTIIKSRALGEMVAEKMQNKTKDDD